MGRPGAVVRRLAPSVAVSVAFWGPLGVLFGCLWGLVDRLGGLFGPPWSPLGPSWGLLGGLSCCPGAILEAVGAVMGPREPKKTRTLKCSKNHRKINVFGFWRRFRRSSWGPPGPSCGPLGPSWGNLGPPWGRLEAILNHLEAFLGPQEAQEAKGLDFPYVLVRFWVPEGGRQFWYGGVARLQRGG